VTSSRSQIVAFESAISSGLDGSSIDIVIASAGLWGVPFLLPNDEAASLDKDPAAPPLGPINVNLIGLSYTAKLAQHYFSLPGPTTTSDKTLILIGSSGGYLEIPLAATYNASKWGVRGLFRTIREPLAAKGIRVNLIAPWLTDTPMSRADSPAFKAVDLPIADPEVFVKAAIRCAVDASIVGRAFAVRLWTWPMTRMGMMGRWV
jgi:5'-hydroxyaverantin dehydrogenase